MQSKLSAFINWIKPTTKWQKFILIITLFAFIFAIISLVITVIALSILPLARETVSITREYFFNFGLFLGSLIIVGSRFLGTLIIPFVLWIVQKYSFSVENGKGFGMDLLRFAALALIEALAFSNFFASFSGMCNDSFVFFLNYGPLTTGQGTPTFGSFIPFELIRLIKKWAVMDYFFRIFTY
jgi:hypothetical protein